MDIDPLFPSDPNPAQAARLSVATAIDSTPDLEADLRKSAQLTGVPIAAARSFPEDVKRQAQLTSFDFDGMAVQFPSTAKFLGNVDNARIAHDDVPNLSELESAVQALRGPEASFLTVVKGLASSLPLGAEMARQGMRMQFADLFGFESMRADAQRKYSGASLESDLNTPRFDSATARGVYSGGASTVRMIPGLVASLFAKSTVPMMASMGVQTESEAYGKYRNRGASPTMSAVGGFGEGATEVLTEMLPMGFMVKQFGKVGAGQFLTGLLAREVPTEQLATLVQDAIDTAIANPDKTWKQYAQERPGAAYETLVATVTQAGVMSAGHSAARRFSGEAERAAAADEAAQVLQKINDLATNSKLRERDPAAFEAFIKDAAQDGPVQDVYINAATFAQSAQDAGIGIEQIAALSPELAAQLQGVEATGDLRIPVELYAGRIAGTDLHQILAPHLKTDPTGMSQTEAAAFMQNHADELEQEVARTLQAKAGDDAFKASRDEVTAAMQTQLTTAGRFTEDVNSAYASMLGNFYAVTAARLGITPTEMLSRYPLKVAVERMVGGQTLDQRAGPTVEQFNALGSGFTIDSGKLMKQGKAVGDIDLTVKTDGASPRLVINNINVSKKGIGTGTMAVAALMGKAAQYDMPVEVIAPDGLRPYFERIGFKHDGTKLEWTPERGTFNQSALPDTIEVDGAQRSTTNSEGKPLAQTDEGVRNFWRWFSDSKVVDAEGKPLVVYHGTGAKFSEFATKDGAFFTSSKAIAKDYGERSDDGRVEAAYLSIKRPLIIDARGDSWDEINVAGIDADQATLRKIFGALSSTYTTQEIVLAVKASGLDYDGVMFEGALDVPQGRQRRSNVFVAFNPEQIKSANGNDGTFDAGDRSILSQENRASISFGTDITQQPSVISLFKNADLSSFLHESGHFFLEVMNDIASMPDAPVDMQQDMAALLKWFGVQGSPEQSALDAWNALSLEEKRPHHEQLARGFEAYLFEGKSPNVELTSLFQRFRAWMVNVYKSLKALNVELSDDVRGVFDRMLATSETIAEAEAVRGYGDLFQNKPAYLTDEEWRDYQTLGQQATQDAVQTLETRSLRDMQWLTNAKAKVLAKLQRDAAEKRKAVRREVETEVMAEPVNRVRQFLKRGEMVGEDGEIIKVEKGAKLDHAALAEMYPETMLARPDLSGLNGMTRTDGLHPDLVSDMFGFSSGDELVRSLLDAPPAREKIDALTDERMLEKYGDLTDPVALSRATDAALHNDARIRFVMTELNALNRATGAPRMLASAAKAFADASIARLKVRDLRPSQYAAAAAKAAKASAAAFKKGDIETAAGEKRNQLINEYAAKAAHAARDAVDRDLAYYKKFDRDSIRKSIDSEYLDQIHALLGRFELRKVSLKEVDRRTSLLAWVEAQRERGIEPDLPDNLLDEAYRQSYRNMTVEDMAGLRDTVAQIEHLGRLKNKLLTAQNQRAYEAVRDEIAAGIEQHAGNRTADTRTPNTNMGRRVQGLKRFWAAHIKVATWARIMDGGKDGGPVWEYFIRSANVAGDQETTMRAAATRELALILDPVFKLGKMGGKGQFFPSINRSLNREARITMALNVGNAGNLQRLLGGEGWTLAQVQPVLDSLTKPEWDAVQAIWDHLESYRGAIGAKERRVYGKEPNWVEPTPVTTPHGEYRGGYYPVKFDPAASQRAEEHADAEGAKRQLQGAYTSATTRRSFTKSRVEAVTGRPLLYSMAGLYTGVNDVIHDLAWHEWLIDANRLLRSNTIDTVIREKYGPAVKAQFKSWVADVAEGDKGAADAIEMAVGKLRQNISVAGLGYNVMSAAMQGLGITQSIVRVGPVGILRGIQQYLANPVRATKLVNGLSPFMASRSRTRYRELNELRNQVQDQHAAERNLKTYAYVMMMRLQQTVDTPTWLGAYEKAVGEGNAEDRSIALADQAVIDAQGGGQLKDLASIERGGNAAKLFTVFYSFMNTALNIGVAQTMTSKNRAKLASDYLLLFTVPAVLGFLLKNAFTPGDSGDDEDWGKLLAKFGAEQLSYVMGLMVITREFAAAGKALLPTGDKQQDYTGPSGVRIVADTYRFSKQAAQGEFDDAFRNAAINLTGDLFGLPAAQANRMITGTKAYSEGKTDNPAAIVFGYQEKH